MERSVNAEVVASTFDEPADKHVKVSVSFYKRQNVWWNADRMLLSCSIR